MSLPDVSWRNWTPRFDKTTCRLRVKGRDLCTESVAITDVMAIVRVNLWRTYLVFILADSTAVWFGISSSGKFSGSFTSVSQFLFRGFFFVHIPTLFKNSARYPVTLPSLHDARSHFPYKELSRVQHIQNDNRYRWKCYGSQVHRDTVSESWVTNRGTETSITTVAVHKTKLGNVGGS